MEKKLLQVCNIETVKAERLTATICHRDDGCREIAVPVCHRGDCWHRGCHGHMS